ncbi:MAG: aminotransferase class IV, partial [Betaproteobacteria bacterium]|nr:aminotransferase class IV [Betaproteobacteria bacterium]
LTEFTRANLALLIDGTIVTPPLSSGLLDGTLREEFVARGEWVERVLMPGDLERAERIGWVNSVRGWVDVTLDAPGA